MVNTTEKSDKGRSWLKLVLAILILGVFFVFINPSVYDLIAKRFVKNQAKYVEMIAYSKAQGVDERKYFIVQENSLAKSFFEGKMEIITEGELCNIKGNDKEITIVYEKPSEKISKFIKDNAGQELTLNPGQNIEFHAVKLKAVKETCNVGR